MYNLIVVLGLLPFAIFTALCLLGILWAIVKSPLTWVILAIGTVLAVKWYGLMS